MIAIRGPVLLALEFKSATGKPTDDQLAWLRALEGVRHVDAVVVRPADSMEGIEKYLGAWEAVTEHG